jgi:hypothetical protein
MWLLFMFLAVGACVATSGSSFFLVALVNAGLALWANGALASRRNSRTLSEPRWAVLLSGATAVGSLGLGIAGLVLG